MRVAQAAVAAACNNQLIARIYEIPNQFAVIFPKSDSARRHGDSPVFAVFSVTMATAARTAISGLEPLSVVESDE